MKTFNSIVTRLLKSLIASVLAAGSFNACADEGMDPHAMHHHMMMASMSDDVKISNVQYVLPKVNLVRDDGKKVVLTDELNDGRPVIADFIYTSCTQICPVSSRIFMQLQEKLGADRSKVHLVSFSIDPEQDTPSVLREYAKRFEAGPQWRYYTGTSEASIETQRAFDVYRGDKMNHVPVTLMRAAPGKPWVRVDGFASADQLMIIYRKMTSTH